MRDGTPSVAPAPSTAVQPRGIAGVCARYFAVLAGLVLALALFNLTFRLGQEFLTEWDESLYATAASEALDGGHWIGTTMEGELDYYNTKPPLNVWLIALTFKIFGKSLFALRLISVVAAWLTVLALLLWTRRSLGPTVALLSGVVLATSFGFIHVHSGRSANTDALFALIVLLTVVALWAEQRRPWARVWLGPLLAAAFLLRGMAVLMPLALVAGVWLLRRPAPKRALAPTLVAIALCVVPVGAWMIARYRVDQWQFLDRLFFYDFVARSTGVIEGHPGGLFYYLNILQKHQFDWLFLALVALLLAPIRWAAIRQSVARWREPSLAVLMTAWVGVTLLEPTLMQTKLPWYLNTFYPAFAIGVAWLAVRAASAVASAPPWRRWALAVAFVVAFGVAESKLVWYSFVYRDLALTDQSLVLASMEQLAGHRLYREHEDRAGAFVTGLAHAEPRYARDSQSFLHDSQPGDYLVTSEAVSHPDLQLVRSNGRYSLYRHGGKGDRANGRSAKPSGVRD
jgi:4-amino-4-deoxy-L-arabinose transferase-like glycosyltransferase